MAAEDRSHPWLIDALYPEERDEQPTSPPSTEDATEQGSGELSRSAQQEVAQYRAMLGEVRQGLVTFQPREELRETIREAARKEAEAIVSKMAAEQGPRRASRPRHATGDATDSTSFWSRARSQGAIQLIAVLAVCLGAGLLVRAISGQGGPSMEAKFSPAAIEAQEEFAASEKQSTQKPSPEELAAPEERRTREPSFALNDEAEARPADDPRRRNRRGTTADFDEFDYEKRREQDEARQELALKQEMAPTKLSRLSKKNVATKSKNSSWAEKSAPAPLESQVADKNAEASNTGRGGSLDDTGADTDASPARAASKTDRKDVAVKGSFDSIFGGQEDVVQQEAMEEEARPPIISGKRSAMGNALEGDGSSYGPAPSQASPEAQSAPAPAKPTSATTNKESKKSDDPEVGTSRNAPSTSQHSEPEPREVTSATLDDAESSYKRNDYRQTIEDADNYLARDIGTNRERARAMELKAQALTALGRGTEARSIYEAIRETYPDYYKKENLQMKKKRKAAPRRESTQSADEVLQSF